MKRLFLVSIFVLSASWAFAQREKAYIKLGNDLYNKKSYRDAAVLYGKAVEKKSESVEGQFNLGDAFYKQKQFDKAAEQFNKIGSSSKNKTVAASAYHNLGNTLLENQKLEESIEAYKKSLLSNPKDEQTRYNLAYALEKLKKQKEDKKNNKENKKNQDKKDQNKDKQDQNNNDQNKKDQDKEKQQQPDTKISKDDAQRMLDALNNQEKETQEKLKDKKVKVGGGKPTKDW
jgi:Ca-activated chloride channel family protein